MKIAGFIGIRDSLFYIGAIVFSVTLFIEHLFQMNMNVTEFLKGFGIGLELLGAVFLIIKRRSH